MTVLLICLAFSDPALAAVALNALVGVVASAMWVRIEHRLTQIETNCQRCDNQKGKS